MKRNYIPVKNYIPVRTMWMDKDTYEPEDNSLSVGFSLDPDLEARVVLCQYDTQGKTICESHIDATEITALLNHLGIQSIGIQEMNESIQRILADQQQAS